MKTTFRILSFITLFLLGNSILVQAQQTHFKNTIEYLAQAKVSGRTTWNMNEKPQLISIDQYNEKGNKTEAYEFYDGKRFLHKIGPNGWTDLHDSTHYSFEYDLHGQQTRQINHDFPHSATTDSYHMYQYDKFGNIERWQMGRSFQLPHIQTFAYDENGSVIAESSCWVDTCESESKEYKTWTTDLKHYLKYDSKQMLIEDLVNYMDGMSGFQYAYTFNGQGKLINMKKYSVWSYFGIDHEIPTSKDINQTKLYQEWKFEYNSKGQLHKETRIDHWTDSPLYQSTFTYNDQGLIVESLIDGQDLVRYTYNEKGLVIEERHYYPMGKEDKLHTTLKFEYAYRY